MPFGYLQLLSALRGHVGLEFPPLSISWSFALSFYFTVLIFDKWSRVNPLSRAAGIISNRTNKALASVMKESIIYTQRNPTLIHSDSNPHANTIHFKSKLLKRVSPPAQSSVGTTVFFFCLGLCCVTSVCFLKGFFFQLVLLIGLCIWHGILEPHKIKILCWAREMPV